MTSKYLSVSHDKNCSNSLNAEERCFSASFLISISTGMSKVWPAFKRPMACLACHIILVNQASSRCIFSIHLMVAGLWHICRHSPSRNYADGANAFLLTDSKQAKEWLPGSRHLQKGTGHGHSREM